MKYVLFLDILGFKDRLKRLDQPTAKSFITNFSSEIYDLWSGNPKYENNLYGYIVSDSLIISTKDTTMQSLDALLDAAVSICQIEFAKNSILLRGAIAKGEFDKLEAKELKTLGKGLIVGQAYVDAYLLEGTVKTIGIVLSQDVYSDFNEIDSANDYAITEETVSGQKSYILQYLSIDFIMNTENLVKFTELARNAQWLPHYYNALYIAMKNESANKADHVFNNIISIINKDKPSEHWSELDSFIQNIFTDGVITNCQRRFLRFIRNRIIIEN